MQLKIISVARCNRHRAASHNRTPQVIIPSRGTNDLGRGGSTANCFYDSPFFLAQRACAARWAITFLSSADNFAALACPPFRAPSFPRVTAAGFFFLGFDGNCIVFRFSVNGAPTAASTTLRAFWATSPLLARLCMALLCHIYGLKFKTAHYRGKRSRLKSCPCRARL